VGIFFRWNEYGIPNVARFTKVLESIGYEKPTCPTGSEDVFPTPSFRLNNDRLPPLDATAQSTHRASRRLVQFDAGRHIVDNGLAKRNGSFEVRRQVARELAMASDVHHLDWVEAT
jgi:hypothetical protein